MDFCEGQLAKVAYLLNHVTDLEPRFADELDGLLGPEVLNHVCSPLIRIQHELELVQKAASALLKTNSVPGGPEPRNALADLIGLLVERYEKLTGERFTHSPYGPRTAGKYIGKPESKAGIFLVEILHPDAYVIKHSGETEYEWPTEKQIATAMRQFIARRNKQAKSKI